MKVLVTGSSGFIGKNLIENLRLIPDTMVLSFDATDPVSMLSQHALSADIIFHLAGVNRPTEDAEFVHGNVDLTQSLTDILRKAGGKKPIVFSSSIQAEQDNPYGRSKKAAEELLLDYGRESGAPVHIFRLPNVFGKWCRPNYNSVVATFCYNVARELPIRVDAPEKELSLVYIDDVVATFLPFVSGQEQEKGNSPYVEISPVHRITLAYLSKMILGFNASRENLTYNETRTDPMVRKLYATFLSYLPTDQFSHAADMKHDARGYFAELIKSQHFGQISVSRTKPGVTRGNHWHNTKVEKFIVIEGEARITFRRIDDDDEVLSYEVSGKSIEIVDIPPGYTHAIENIGTGDVLTIFWAGDLFDPNNPDTNYLEV